MYFPYNEINKHKMSVKTVSSMEVFLPSPHPGTLSQSLSVFVCLKAFG